MNLLTNYKSQVKEISQLMLQGIECWQKAGERLCEMIDADPTVIDRIREDAPMLTPTILRQLERIGRKQLVPELLMKSGCGWNRLRLTSYETQKKYLANPVKVLIETPDGPDELSVSIDNLSHSQARQVFADDGTVRDLGAQRAWIMANVPVVEIPEEARKAYAVHGRNLVINKPCKLSLQEIGVILAEMKG